MSRNLFNLFAVIVIFTIVTACVRRSGRTDEPNTAPTPADSSKANSPKDKQTPSADITNDAESGNKKADKGDFTVEHIAVKNPRYEEIDRQWKPIRVR